MTKNPEVLERVYWTTNEEWYTYKPGEGYDGYSIKDDAPERAKRSFEEWLKHQDD